MSFLDFMSDAFGAGWSYLASQNSSKKSYAYQKALMNDAYKIQKKGYLENPSLVRQGLEKAGFNPIMGQGSTNAFSSGVGTPSSQTFDAGANLTNAFNARTQRRLSEAQINNTNASTNNINADTENKKVQKGILMADEKIRQYEIDMKKFDRDTQAYRFASEMKEMWSRTKLNLENAMFVDYNATSNRIAANAQQLQAETSEKWTPGKIGAGLAVGALGLFGPGKLKTLKNVTKVTKRSRNGRSSISQIFNEY